MKPRATVVGAGSWGTALALVLHRNGHPVRLWSYEAEVARAIREEGENRAYLAGVPVPRDIQVSTDLGKALEGAELVVSVTPAQFVAKVMGEAAPHLDPDTIVVSASKGIEIGTLRRVDEVLASILPSRAAERLVILSGPSFALEVAKETPTAVVAASASEEARVAVQRAFVSPTFRVYTNADVVGVGLSGALKNVVAIAAGVCAGLDFGHNTQAALITRGLAEMTRLGVAMGAQPSTFYGLAGIGDLVLTCTGELSRNRTTGFRIGRGESVAAILADTRSVVEGVLTTPAAHALAKREGVEMPIVEQMNAILGGGKPPREAVQELMLRDPKPESELTR
jgi:glycerol-3-phosphate dehydrogenase (NAD(P)+)